MPIEQLKIKKIDKALTIWVKQLKNLTLMIGLLMHLGIYFLIMIHDFEILFIATYGLFITDDEWNRYYLNLKKFINVSKRLPS